MESKIYKGEFLKILQNCSEILTSFALLRKDQRNNDVLVVYLVPAVLTPAIASCSDCGELLVELSAGSKYPFDLTQALGSVPPIPTRVILINAMPHNPDGSVDEAALIAIPIQDATVIADWTQAILSNESVEQAAVFNVVNHHQTGFLHRSDVFHSMDERTVKSGHSSDQKKLVAKESADSRKPPIGSALAEVHNPGEALTQDLDGNYRLSLANTLFRAAEISPEKGISYIDQSGKRSFQSYGQLLEDAKQLLAGLQANGIRAGHKVLLQCVENRDFLTVFWACVLGAIVPVPMSIAPYFKKDNAVVQKLLNVWQLFDQPVIVCSDRLASEFDQLSKESELSQQQVLCFGQLTQDNTGSVAKFETEVPPDALALLLLTSGSTGTPKAVMHNHQSLINRSAASSAYNRFDRDDISLNWMPLDHVGGIVMFHLRDVYNACSQIQVATSWVLEQPLRWLDTIDSERASITWAPNFAFALVVDQAGKIAQQSWDLSCMRFVLNGGEAVVARTAVRFLELLQKDKLPVDAINPAWGMSETASGVCYSHNFSIQSRADSDGAVEVGGVIPNTSLRIVGGEDRVLNEGEKGNLQIKGSSVTPGYYLNPEENRQAFSADGWFNTGDVGILRNGCLTITARVKDEIIVNGVNYPAAEIETSTESVSGVAVSFTAACAVRRSGDDTDSLAIFFNPGDNEPVPDLLKKIQETVSSSLGVTPEYIIPLSQAQIPKTNIGKIQRSLLKQKFEQGEFDDDLKMSERLLGTNVIPDWFYSKTWHAKSLDVSNPVESRILDHRKKYLLFSDNVGFAAAICNKLIETGAQVVVVANAGKYECFDKSAYTINPSSPDQYVQLLRALQQADFQPDLVIHCWCYAEVVDFSRLDEFKRIHQLGIYSLLNIIQALVQCNSSERQTKLVVASCDVQQCLPEECFLNPHATIMGLLNSAPREHDWLSTQHIDFSFYETDSELSWQADALTNEIISESREGEIAYRCGLRYGSLLVPETFSGDSFTSNPIRPGGIIVITGGLGGVGSMLARFLVKNFNARLLLIGRSALPERDKWPELVDQGGKTSELISRYLEIEALQAEFIYSVADVSDPDALQRVVSDAEQHWNGQLNGVFHLAVGGDIGTRSVVDESIDSFELMFASKVYGSLALANLVAHRETAFLVSFGSVIAEFGEAKYSAYTAAHTFLSQLTSYYNQQMPGRYYQFDWGSWENIPLFAIDYFRSQGYSLISAKVGMDCLLAGLCHQRSHLMIGLDAANWSIRKHLAFDHQSLLQLVCCFTVNDQKTNLKSWLGEFNISDIFQVHSQCELRQIEYLPETAEGKLDIPALQVMVENEFPENNELPATEMEKRIADYWSELLDVNEPGRFSSFFQLGGDSLTGMQLISRLNQAFDINLEMRDLFTTFNIAEMAVLIENRQSQAGMKMLEAEPCPDQTESLTANELLANIDELSDEQVAALLAKMQLDAET